MVANAAAASGGRSSPSQGPATPRTSTVSTVLTIIRRTWIARLVANRDALTPMAMIANSTPALIRISSCCTAYDGICARESRNATAAMIAAAPMPLIAASRHDRRGSWPAQAPGIRLNGLSAGFPADALLSAATYLLAGPARAEGHFHHVER